MTEKKMHREQRISVFDAQGSITTHSIVYWARNIMRLTDTQNAYVIRRLLDEYRQKLKIPQGNFLALSSENFAVPECTGPTAKRLGILTQRICYFAGQIEHFRPKCAIVHWEASVEEWVGFSRPELCPSAFLQSTRGYARPDETLQKKTLNEGVPGKNGEPGAAEPRVDQDEEPVNCPVTTDMRQTEDSIFRQHLAVHDEPEKVTVATQRAPEEDKIPRQNEAVIPERTASLGPPSQE